VSAEAELLWHGDRDLKGVDAVVVPGGFSYGDYLRAGAIARFAPVMESVIEFANEGGLVLGICNGFQILCEAGLLPGALLDNESLKFVFRQVQMDVVDRNTPFTRNCPPTLLAPVKHMSAVLLAGAGPGRAQVCGRSQPERLAGHIAGVVNIAGNVFGLMPHPEHAVDPLTGSEDGLNIFESIRAAVDERVRVA